MSIYSEMMDAVNPQWHQWSTTMSTPETPDYLARLEAMRLAIQYADNNMVPSEFPQVLTQAQMIYRFLTGQACPLCEARKETSVEAGLAR